MSFVVDEEPTPPASVASSRLLVGSGGGPGILAIGGMSSGNGIQFLSETDVLRERLDLITRRLEVIEKLVGGAEFAAAVDAAMAIGENNSRE